MELREQIDVRKRKSKIVVIEGLDAVGKHTQASLMKKRLESEYGLKVAMHSFPDYEEPSADLINLWLNREYDCKNAYAVASLYSINRFNTIFNGDDTLLDDIMNKDIVIFDRYTGSNVLHAMTLIDNLVEKSNFCRFLREYEFDLLKLPDPDLAIFLDLDVKVSHMLCLQRACEDGRKIDENEDLKYQTQCADNKEFLKLFYNNTVTIDCNKYGPNGISYDILPIKDILDKIMYSLGGIL